MEVRFGRQNSRKSLPTAYFPGVSVSEGVLQRVHEFNDVHCDDMGMARQRVEFGAQKLEWNRTDDGTTVPSFIKPAMMRLVTTAISLPLMIRPRAVRLPASRPASRSMSLAATARSRSPP